MKGIIEHSIQSENTEVYRGWVRYRGKGNDSGLNSLPESEPELTAKAKCQAGVHPEQQGKRAASAALTQSGQPASRDTI